MDPDFRQDDGGAAAPIRDVPLTLNSMPKDSDADLQEVLVFRHRPYEPALNRIFEREGRPALLPLLLLLFAALGLGGCQHVIEPPATVSDPVRVFVIDYGRHASLALPMEDSDLVEWSWGDWNWYALERTGAAEGLQALFASPRSTLSRRELAAAEDADELAMRVGAEEALSLDVERERTRALLRHLEARWLQRREEAVRHPSGRVFVPDDSRYSLFNNSVHELARWLEALGADVSGTGVTANFKLREPRSAPHNPKGR